MKTNNKKQFEEIADDESISITGGGAPITFYSSCRFNPSRFEDAHDPYIIGLGECCHCVYNHHRNWLDSTCNYEEDNAQSKETK